MTDEQQLTAAGNEMSASFLAAKKRSDETLAKLEAKPSSFTMLTGDRPTGRLHLGHYFGSIRERVAMQERGVNTNIIIADYQVITDRDTTELIKKSPTDSERRITFDPVARPQVSALLTTAGLVTGRDPKDIAEEIGDSGAGALKAYVIESVNEFLAPHRERRAELAKDMDSIRDILHDGNKRANAIAEETLDQVREAMGMKY